MKEKDYTDMPGYPKDIDPFASFMKEKSDSGSSSSKAGFATGIAPDAPDGGEIDHPGAGTATNPIIEDIVKDYRIVRTVSETSTSIVYKAEDIRTKRRVAMKVIYNRGIPDFERINRARVEIERMRHLSHPGIAALLDAGMTNEGHCYFVSEFIKGVSLSEYISIHKLSQDDRLAIFARICEAIHYSHQKCLLHRDLRPSNIIIDGKCNPKIVGFGVAGVTDVDVGPAKEGSGKRELREFLAYKSPEQVAGRLFDIDVRSEVYNLGVILYELLTDRLPYDCNSENGKEIVEAVVNEMPPKPSSVKAHLRGDLEAITLKALEKQPTDRYQTVAALSYDLENYFDQRPVGARRAGALYEFRKLATRYKSRTISVVITTLAVLAFGVHIHTTTRQAGQLLVTEVEQRAANEIAQHAMAKQFAIEEMRNAQASMEEARAELDRMRKRIQNVQGEAEAVDDRLDQLAERAERAESRAQVFERMARFWVERLGASGGRKVRPTVDTGSLMDGAVADAQKEFADAPLARASILNDAGGFYAGIGRNEDAIPILEDALRTRGGELGDTHPDTIDTLNTLSSTLFRAKRPADAEPFARRLVDATREVFGPDDGRTLTAMNNLGMTLIPQGKFNEAEQYLREALEGRRKTLGEKSRKTAATWQNLGLVYFEQEKFEDAAGAFQSALEVLQERAPTGSIALCEARVRLGASLLKLERYNESIAALRTAAEGLSAKLGDSHRVTRDCLTMLADALERSGDADGAATVRARLGSDSTNSPAPN